MHCIEDLVGRDRKGSSSYHKQQVLREAAGYGKFDEALVVAFGTCASPLPQCAETSLSGATCLCLTLVSLLNQKSMLSWGYTESVVASEVGRKNLRQAIYKQRVRRYRAVLLSHRSRRQRTNRNCWLAPGCTYVVNVFDNRLYHKYDSLAFDRYTSKALPGEVRSIETTHGLIRLCIDQQPFLFVSGVKISLVVSKKSFHHRNMLRRSASHNAAATLSWLFPSICSYLRHEVISG